MNTTKRQVLPAGLWIVATPIGNLSDMTPRACIALQEAGVILCEDTRRTAALLSALGITQFTKRLERLDAHTGEQEIQNWVERLKVGGSFALVTDAGTPSVSDPGATLVARAREVGIRITPFPGASAVLTLLSVSGFHETPFTFRGFFPRKSEEQKRELELAAASDLSHVYVWFESPLRIIKAFLLLNEVFPEVQVIVGKELTKIHEHLFYGTATEVLQKIQEEITAVGSIGEWCFAIQFPKRKQLETLGVAPLDKNSDWIKALRCLSDAGISVSEAAKSVSQHFGMPRRTIYETALQIFGKK